MGLFEGFLNIDKSMKVVSELPDFDNNGNIPYAIYDISLCDFKQKFVHEFNGSETRQNIYDEYVSFSGNLISYALANIEWICGSYTTNKKNPGDIDLIIHYDALKYNDSIEKFDFYDSVLSNHETKIMRCHTFFIPVYPKDDKRFSLTKRHIKKRAKWFTKDRESNKRGMIQMKLDCNDYMDSIKDDLGVQNGCQ